MTNERHLSNSASGLIWRDYLSVFFLYFGLINSNGQMMGLFGLIILALE